MLVVTPPDGNMRNAVVTVSVLNPKTNQYTQMGKTYVTAQRSQGTVVIGILGKQKKLVVAVPANALIDWTLQNDVYCSFVDTRNHRYLLLFQKPEEARIFTMIALAAKLNGRNEPICIVKKDGPPIPQNDRFTVNYCCYDLMKGKVEAPFTEEKNFEIGPTDETPLRLIANGGTMGSVFLVKYPNNVVAIVESISKDQPLPQLPASDQPQTKAQPQQSPTPAPAPTSAPPPASTSPSAQAPTPPPAPAPAKPAPAPAPEAAPAKAQPQKPAEKKPEPAHQPAAKPAPAPVPHPKPQVRQAEARPMYEAQLESIRKEMQDKFNELTQMMASLKRTQLVQNNIALTSDVLVSSVQRLLKENQAKDQLIAEKQQLIDLLNERHTDTRERDAMRVQLTELGSKLAAQRQLTKEKTEQQKGLTEQIEELQRQIVNAKGDAETKISTLHRQLELEKQKQADELEQSKRQLQYNLKQAEDELAKIREQFEKALAQNKALSSESKKDYTAELSALKSKVPLLIENTVKRMISGVYEMIEDTFDEDSEYDGAAIMKAVKLALQKQANEMADEIDPGDDEEDYEEEDES